MNFSNKIRLEIISSINKNTEKNLALFYGVFISSVSLNQKKIKLKSEIKDVIEFYQTVINSNLDITVNYKTMITNKKTYYVIESIDKKINNEIKKFILWIKKYVITSKYTNDIIKGIFINCGNISNPKNKYYLEFSNIDKDLIMILNNKLAELEFIFRYKMVNKKHIIYTTNSTIIEDFLTYIGASKSSLEIMNVKVYKNLRNKVNRIVNCETSNINKIILASSNQVKCINEIINKKGLNYLNNDLREIAIKRLENPDISLIELSKILSFKISKSGLNRKLKKIENIAKEIEN